MEKDEYADDLMEDIELGPLQKKFSAAVLCDKPEAPSLIEQVGAEKLVIDLVMSDVPVGRIIAQLVERWPLTKFTKADIEQFIIRNKIITRDLIKDDRKVARRHAEANFMFKDKLLHMQELCEFSMKAAVDEKEYGAIANLHNAILKNIHLFARLSGHLDGPQAEINVNVGQDVAKIVSDKMAAQRDSFLAKVDAIDIDIDEEVVTEDGGN